MPGQQGDGGLQGRDSSTGDLNSGQSGLPNSPGGASGGPGGDYSLDTLPNGVLSGTGQQGAAASTGARGASTSAERAAILDEALRRGYETFDGFILSEREQAQNESNAAGSAAIDGGATGGPGGGQNQPQVMEQTSTAVPSGVVAAVSQPAPGGPEEMETFPPPDDIPSGRDDDVVARQIREAALQEPDPELREALWERYRIYTGIGEER